MKELTKTAAAGAADFDKEQDVVRPEDLARMQHGEQESTPPDIIVEN